MNRYKEEKEKDYMGLYVAEAAHFVKQIYRPCLPGRNKKSGTLCSFIENEKKRPSSSCQICQRFRQKRNDKKSENVTRTKRQSERKGREVKTCWCFGDQ